MSEQIVASYRRASEAGDIPALMRTLTEDVELVSPLSNRMVFRGRDDVGHLLTIVYGVLRGWRWHAAIGDGDERVLVGEGRIGPVRLGDAMVVELAADGRVRRLRPHLRPVLGLGLFGLALGARLGRRPGVLLRALGAGSPPGR